MPRVIHFEIHAGDPDRAIKFYKNLFDWTFQKWEGPMEYWLVTTGPNDQPGINGGLLRRQGEIDGQAVIAYVCTIDVDDIDASLKTAEANGARWRFLRCRFREWVGWSIARTPKATSSV
jgi:predicted enzyme related to lactoylglutathione lyase